jgi:hypothetical protein
MLLPFQFKTEQQLSQTVVLQLSETTLHNDTSWLLIAFIVLPQFCNCIEQKPENTSVYG